jgi:hypothetical protein
LKGANESKVDILKQGDNAILSNKIVFSTSPPELPLLPQKPPSHRDMTATRSSSNGLLSGLVDKDGFGRRQVGGGHMVVSQHEDYSCCFINSSSPATQLMTTVSLEVHIAPKESIAEAMLRLARGGSKEYIYGKDYR